MPITYSPHESPCLPELGRTVCSGLWGAHGVFAQASGAHTQGGWWGGGFNPACQLMPSEGQPPPFSLSTPFISFLCPVYPLNSVFNSICFNSKRYSWSSHYIYIRNYAGGSHTRDGEGNNVYVLPCWGPAILLSQLPSAKTSLICSVLLTCRSHFA